jgi:hypothetical protein
MGRLKCGRSPGRVPTACDITRSYCPPGTEGDGEEIRRPPSPSPTVVVVDQFLLVQLNRIPLSTLLRRVEGEALRQA